MPDTQIDRMADIMAACKDYAEMYQKLDAILQEAGVEMLKVKKRYQARVHKMALALETREKAVTDLVKVAPDLFESPRSHTFFDVKVGFRKEKGKTEIPDEAKTLALIRKHLGDQFDELTKTTVTVSKTAVADLCARDVKKIGVAITEDTDVVVFKPQGNDLAKMVAALYPKPKD